MLQPVKHRVPTTVGQNNLPLGHNWNVSVKFVFVIWCSRRVPETAEPTFRPFKDIKRHVLLPLCR